jgi:IclR family transcriptional regulator, KDG regulon repressor
MADDIGKSHNDKYILQSVDNALSILQLLCQYDELSVTEIAHFMRIGKSTAFRLLATLENQNFVDKTKDNKYCLGIKLASIGRIVTHRMEIVRLAHPYLVDLTNLSVETSHLSVLSSDTEVQFMDKVSSPSSIRMESRIGLRCTAHTTASGKVLLAFQDEKFISNYMKTAVFIAKTPYSIISPEQLKNELGIISATGYSCDINASEMGLTCFAAPVFDMMHSVIAAISVSGPSERMSTKEEQLIKLVMKIAHDVSLLISK